MFYWDITVKRKQATTMTGSHDVERVTPFNQSTNQSHFKVASATNSYFKDHKEKGQLKGKTVVL